MAPSPEQSRINGAKGGRPKGALSASTLEKRKVEAAFNQRILKHANDLFNAQLNLAKGVTHVYKIVESGEGKTKKREHVLVTDPEEIKALLDEHDGGNGVVDDTYYYITTKDPQNMSIDSLLNRGIGKPTDKVDVTTDGEALTSNKELLELSKQLNELRKAQ